MRTSLIRTAFAAVAAVAAVAALASLTAGRSEAEPAPVAAAAPLAHMVFFTLANRSEENAKKLTEACQTYLTGHEGTVYFSVGTRAEEFTRDVNDSEFDVALHLVFDSKEAHDLYQDHPRHNEFIEKSQELWSAVRVFDSYLAPPADGSAR